MWSVCIATKKLKVVPFTGLETGKQRSRSRLRSKAGPERTSGVWQQARGQGEALGIKYWGSIHRDWDSAPVLGRLCEGRRGPRPWYRVPGRKLRQKSRHQRRNMAAVTGPGPEGRVCPWRQSRPSDGALKAAQEPQRGVQRPPECFSTVPMPEKR